MKGILEEKYIECSYPCYIRFNEPGYYCGYVGIPKENSVYRKIKEDPTIVPNIRCHGGITYENDILPGIDEDVNMYFIGFDCAHVEDGFNVAKCRQLFGEKPWYTVYASTLKPVSLDTVKRNISRIIGRLIALED